MRVHTIISGIEVVIFERVRALRMLVVQRFPRLDLLAKEENRFRGCDLARNVFSNVV